jgi:hypothetical protein
MGDEGRFSGAEKGKEGYTATSLLGENGCIVPAKQQGTGGIEDGGGRPSTPLRLPATRKWPGDYKD